MRAAPGSLRILCVGACTLVLLLGAACNDDDAVPDGSASPSASESDVGTKVGLPPGMKGTVAFQSNRDGDNDIYVIDLSTGDVVNSTDNSAEDYHPEWAPDGRQLVFARVVKLDLELFVIGRDGEGEARLTDDDSNEDFPEWSPDGRWIAYASDASGSSDIYVMRSDGSDARRVTTGDSAETVPSWSPDGASLVYQSDRDGNLELYSIGVDGQNERRLTQSETDDDAFPSWGPRIAAMVTDAAGNYEVTSVEDGGGGARPLTRDGSGWPDWSPDGASLAVTSPRSSNSEIYVITASGGRAVNITNDPSEDVFPAWSPVG